MPQDRNFEEELRRIRAQQESGEASRRTQSPSAEDIARAAQAEETARRQLASEVARAEEDFLSNVGARQVLEQANSALFDGKGKIVPVNGVFKWETSWHHSESYDNRTEWGRGGYHPASSGSTEHQGRLHGFYLENDGLGVQSNEAIFIGFADDDRISCFGVAADVGGGSSGLLTGSNITSSRSNNLRTLQEEIKGNSVMLTKDWAGYSLIDGPVGPNRYSVKQVLIPSNLRISYTSGQDLSQKLSTLQQSGQAKTAMQDGLRHIANARIFR